MRVYRTTRGIVIQVKGQFFLSKHTDWDNFVSRKDLYFSIAREIQFLQSDPSFWDYIRHALLPPIGQQEIWQLGSIPRLVSTAQRGCSNDQPLRLHGPATCQVGLAFLLGTEANFQGITLLHYLAHQEAYPTQLNYALGPCLWIPEPDVALSWEISSQLVRGNQILSTVKEMMYWRTPQHLTAFWSKQSFQHGVYLTQTIDHPVPPKIEDRLKTTLATLGDLHNRITT